jgi:hypothetical protein
MNKNPGGSVVERSLERLAADRGVTICFADLDGADGLWLPEERTILVDQRLSSVQADEVLEHELAHVDVDDGHAAIDSAVGGNPTQSARWAATFAAAACFALLGGVYVGLSDARRPTVAPHPTPVVAPTGPAPSGQPAQPPPVVGGSSPTTMVTVQLPNAVRTVTVSSEPRPTTAGSSGSVSAHATTAASPMPPKATPAPPAATVTAGGGGQTTPTNTPAVTSEPAPTQPAEPTATGVAVNTASAELGTTALLAPMPTSAGHNTASADSGGLPIQRVLADIAVTVEAPTTGGYAE